MIYDNVCLYFPFCLLFKHHLILLVQICGPQKRPPAFRPATSSESMKSSITQIVMISSVSHSRQSRTIIKQWNGCKDKSNLPIMFHQARKWHNTVMPGDFLVFNLLYTFYRDIKTWQNLVGICSDLSLSPTSAL